MAPKNRMKVKNRRLKALPANTLLLGPSARCTITTGLGPLLCGVLAGARRGGGVVSDSQYLRELPVF
jgi:hypothetical protein